MISRGGSRCPAIFAARSREAGTLPDHGVPPKRRAVSRGRNPPPKELRSAGYIPDSWGVIQREADVPRQHVGFGVRGLYQDGLDRTILFSVITN